MPTDLTTTTTTTTVCHCCEAPLVELKHYDEGPFRAYCGTCSGCAELPVSEQCDYCYYASLLAA